MMHAFCRMTMTVCRGVKQPDTAQIKAIQSHGVGWRRVSTGES